MKGYPLLLLFFLPLCSCKTNNDKLLKELEASIRRSIEDDAFKAQSLATIYELHILHVDTVGQAYLDTIRACKILPQVDRFTQMAESEARLAQLTSEQAALYITRSIRNLKIQEAEEYIDSAATHRAEAALLLDSAVRLRNGQALTGNRKYFRAKVFLKATLKSATDSQNVLDTVQYLFDFNKKLVTP